MGDVRGEAAGGGERADEVAGAGGAPLGDAEASAALTGQAAALVASLGGTVRPDVLLRAVLAWTQLFGMISFELFGQFARTFEPADDLFSYAVARMANLVGA